MRTKRARIRLLPFLLSAVPALAADNPLILPVDEPEASETHRVIWSTEPGIRYELQQSSDLAEWTTVAGFPPEYHTTKTAAFLRPCPAGPG